MYRIPLEISHTNEWSHLYVLLIQSTVYRQCNEFPFHMHFRLCDVILPVHTHPPAGCNQWPCAVKLMFMFEGSRVTGNYYMHGASCVLHMVPKLLLSMTYMGTQLAALHAAGPV